MIDTRTIENFLSNEEIAEINNLAPSWTHVDKNKLYLQIEGLDRTANYHYFEFYKDRGKRINEIILPKLQDTFHKDIYIDDCHILESYFPYDVHTDGAATDDSGEKSFKDGYDAAWTFIIPLEDYNSNTIIFDQNSEDCKTPPEWIKKYNPPLLDSISDHVYNEYLTHAMSREHSRYFSIQEIFPWKKGSISGTSRNNFHSSDYFIGRGIQKKRAIVMWTTLPKN
jgi:hypothetical protein